MMTIRSQEPALNTSPGGVMTGAGNGSGIGVWANPSRPPPTAINTVTSTSKGRACHVISFSALSGIRHFTRGPRCAPSPLRLSLFRPPSLLTIVSLSIRGGGKPDFAGSLGQLLVTAKRQGQGNGQRHQASSFPGWALRSAECLLNGDWRAIDYQQVCPRRSLRLALALLPVTERVDAESEPRGERVLRPAGLRSDGLDVDMLGHVDTIGLLGCTAPSRTRPPPRDPCGCCVLPCSCFSSPVGVHQDLRPLSKAVAICLREIRPFVLRERRQQEQRQPRGSRKK